MKKAWQRIVGRGLFSIIFLVPLVAILEIPVFLAGAALGTYLVYSRDLPEIPALASYQPRTVSTFFADDGTVIGIFYKQKRFVVDLEQMPPHVINAFLAAEDSRFMEHSGVDWIRVFGAMVGNIKAGRITSGGSTITMQVTKNFLLTPERKFSRKVREMLLATRLENAWGKKKILYIYLNEIYLGEGCYGVEAAARGYLDKPVEHLTVAEAALIAGLVASPARYNPFKSEELARHRQLTVLARMLRFGFISQHEYDKAKQQPLQIRKEIVRPFDLVPDFAEAVRRYVVKKYGEEKLYNEGLKVFTTCKVDWQQKASEALEKGLSEVKARQKHLAILRTLPPDQIQALLEKRKTPTLTPGSIYQGVVLKVIRKKNETELQVALNKRLRGMVRLDPPAAAVYKVGQVLALRFENYLGDTPVFIPDEKAQLQGAVVCIENRTGYVRAVVGGASGEHFQFNRAIQARRQPGSAFKPIVYATALEKKSYSPATIIIDEDIVVDFGDEEQQLEASTERDSQGPPGSRDSTPKKPGEWAPRNASGDFLGPISFRRALELSRNICTIKVLMDVGFGPVIDMAKQMGIDSALGRNLSLSLGTSELSLFELTAAYTVFPNSGVYVEPILVKRIEDRFGNVLEDNTALPLLAASLVPHPEPRAEFRDSVMQRASLEPGRRYEEQESEGPDEPKAGTPGEPGSPEQLAALRVHPAMSPQTAYIMTTLLQGVVRQGTGSRMGRYLKRKDLAGKTGTTNHSEDTWFIGFSPDLTAGVWVGFDEKRPVGRREEGARTALPIWGYFMKGVLENRPEREFPVPPGITFKEMLVFAGTPETVYTPKMVTEPVYTPFVDQTLIVSPLDSPEALGSYPGIAMPGFDPNAQAYQAPGPYQTIPPSGAYPEGVYPQQTQAEPVHPMDGRNLFPQDPSPPRVAPARQDPPPAARRPPQGGGYPQAPVAPETPQTQQRVTGPTQDPRAPRVPQQYQNQFRY